MKNAMKKLMSLVLVAILLVSAVPFAASAAGVTKVVIKQDGAVIYENANVAVADAGNTVQELLNASGFDMTNYEVTGAPYIYYAEGKGEATMDTKMVPGRTEFQTVPLPATPKQLLRWLNGESLRSISERD